MNSPVGTKRSLQEGKIKAWDALITNVQYIMEVDNTPMANAIWKT